MTDRPQIRCPRCGQTMTYTGTFVVTDPVTGKVQHSHSTWACDCDASATRMETERMRSELRAEETRRRDGLALRDWLVEEMGFEWRSETGVYLHRQTGAFLGADMIRFALAPGGNRAKFQSVVAETVRRGEEAIRQRLAESGDGPVNCKCALPDERNR